MSAEPENARATALREEITSLRRHIEQLSTRNTRLAGTLQTARDRLSELNAQLEAIAEPASTYGVFLGHSTSRTGKVTTSSGLECAEVWTNGRRMRVKISPQLEPGSLELGHDVRLGEGLIVVEGCGASQTGTVGVIAELLEQVENAPANAPRRALLARNGEEHVVVLGGDIGQQVRAGDTVLFDARAGIAFEIVARVDVADLQLESNPDVDYADIGGLDTQIAAIRDAVELPFLHPELYAAFDLHPPKGVLLYGPPGCGKTLIAKAVATSLGRQMRAVSGAAAGEAAAAKAATGSNDMACFINVKGPELLNKFVGETERYIRRIFARAREVAAQDPHRPVVVFFDEMESIFRTRGSGVSSDMETTVVPQLLTELDGVEELRNVIVIGATNREELIDPAIVRPGRLDIKIKIERPDKAGARDIFARHLPETLPTAAPVGELIAAAVDDLYDARPCLILHHTDGTCTEVPFAAFVSGALIANVVARAKKQAIKRALRFGEPALLSIEDMRAAVAAERAESEHLPEASSPEAWAKITHVGKSGAPIERVEVVN